MTVKVGHTFKVTTDFKVASFSLVRYGSSTHTVNTDQRRIPLTPTDTLGTTYTLKVPSDAGIALPGYWMVFVMSSADSFGCRVHSYLHMKFWSLNLCRSSCDVLISYSVKEEDQAHLVMIGIRIMAASQGSDIRVSVDG